MYIKQINFSLIFIKIVIKTHISKYLQNFQYY